MVVRWFWVIGCLVGVSFVRSSVRPPFRSGVCVYVRSLSRLYVCLLGWLVGRLCVCVCLLLFC